MESFDLEQLEQHTEEARRTLPGPHYYEVLSWIHADRRPAAYVEIGVQQGLSLAQALPETNCIAIDPEPRVDYEFPATRIYPLTSDEFFARHDLTGLLDGPVDLAFIDGLHLFEQVLTDFANLERHSGPKTVILLHDCLPLNEETAGRERTTDFYSGDVWKATLALRRRRPDLEMAMVPTLPTGLCMVRGLDPENRVLEEGLPEIVAEYRDLDLDYYTAHRGDLPPEVPNQQPSVRAWLAGSALGQPAP